MSFLLLPLAWIEELGPLVLVIFWVIRQIISASGGKGEQVEVVEEENQRRKPLTPEQKAQKQSVEQFLREIGAIPEDDVEPIDELEPVKVDRAGADAMDDPAKNQPGWAAAEAAPGVERISVVPIDPFEEPKPSKRQKSVGKSKQSSAARTNPSTKRRALVESQLAENAAHLGEQIGQTDERLEARLHDKFDHQLGKLAHRETTPAEKSAGKQKSQADRILELLASPSGVRDAVVLNEILKSPTDRWD